MLFNAMQLLINYADIIFDAFKETLDNEEYSYWSWAVSSLDEEMYSEVVKPHLNKFRHLYLTESWDNLVYKKDNWIKWKKKTGWLQEDLQDKEFVHFIRANHKFHPKVYLFYSDDKSSWKAFVGSMNLTYADFSTIESMAIITQEDDNANGDLFNRLMLMFEKTIPLSKNIQGNKRAIRREEKNSKQLINIQFQEDINHILEVLQPFFKDGKSERDYNIISMNLQGEDPVVISESVNLSKERVRQIFNKFYRIKPTIIKGLKSSPEAYNKVVNLVRGVFISGGYQSNMEMIMKLNTVKKHQAEGRKKLIDMLSAIIDKKEGDGLKSD